MQKVHWYWKNNTDVERQISAKTCKCEINYGEKYEKKNSKRQITFLI